MSRLVRPPRLLRGAIAAVVVAVVLVCSVTFPASGATTARRVSASAPRVTTSGATTHLGFTLRSARRTTLGSVRVLLRPTCGPGAPGVILATQRLTLTGRRAYAGKTVLAPGRWRAWVTWTRGGRPAHGPATTFTVRATSGAAVAAVSPPARNPKPTPTPAPTPLPTPTPTPAPAPTPTRVFGTLQSSTEHIATNRAAGISLATFDVYWDRFEPVEGHVDATYLSELKTRLATYRAAGVQLVLSPGVQYPPSWLFSYPRSRFVNQYGDAYAPADVGKNVADMVFNQCMRDKQQAYLGRLFATLGTDFYGVRLGGGWYGELNYPDATYAGHTNSYWAFDPVASGQVPGLPTGIPANPVPGWLPGTVSSNHAAAAQFSTWYLEALRNYHDWQIRTARALYPGRLLMMYPSWGLRSGQLDAAVSADLAGTTSAERNGEVQRGFDFARYVRGITDPLVVVYTTWLDADASGDSGTDSRSWSPVKWLALLARDRANPLAVMGENTGWAGRAQIDLALGQARTFGLAAVMWAFEPQLYGSGYATVDDLATAIGLDRAG
ncbi:hypothetical protein BH10ACT10_BH10ACT10_01950 [soil metagenome]